MNEIPKQKGDVKEETDKNNFEDCRKDEKQNSDYYYDDAHGYEIFDAEKEEEDEDQ